MLPDLIKRFFTHRPALATIVENVGWLFIEKVMRLGVGLVVGVWVARYLGPEQFGLLSFALAFTGLFGAAATLGLHEIVVRDIVRNPENVRITLGTSAVLHLMGGFVSFLLITWAIAAARPEDPIARGVVILLASTLLFQFGRIATYWFESQIKSKYTVWVQTGVFLTFAAAKILLIRFQAPLKTFVWITVLEALISAAALLLILNRYGVSLVSLRVKSTCGLRLLRESWPLAVSAVAITIYMKVDQLMLGQMAGDGAVGVYSAAVRVSEVWYFIPTVIVASVFPALLKARERSLELYSARLQRLHDLLAVISVCIAASVAYWATEIVCVLFGDAYAAAGPVVAVHVWASVFVFLGVAGGRWYIAENRQKLTLQRTVLGAIANVVLNLVLIPVYGPVGAAIATVLSYALAAFLSDAVQSETRLLFYIKLRSLNLPAAVARLL